MTLTISGTRHRVLRARAKAQAAEDALVTGETSTDSNSPSQLKTLGSPQAQTTGTTTPLVQLYSQHRPRLPAGNYTIDVSHAFTIPGQANPSPLGRKRDLQVRAPQFTLDQAAIHSVYPPPGAEVSGATLAHVVFHDPYLPWARRLPGSDDSAPVMPWLCLMAFDPAELLLPSDFQTTIGMVQSPASYAFRTSITSLTTARAEFQSPFSGDGAIQAASYTPATSEVSLIMPQRATFEKLFPWGTKPTEQFYRYLAHAREVDVKELADVLGVGDGDQEGMSTYGVMVSPRCGPLGIQAPQTVVMHLVSVESVAAVWQGKGKGVSGGSDRVALVSLHSWSYSCMPANSVDLLDAMQELGTTVQGLRASNEIIRKLTNPPEAKDTEGTVDKPALPGDRKQQNWLASRLQDGFTFVRHRLRNGEVTTGMYRSVLTPTLVPHPLRVDGSDVFPPASLFGTDLQIVDRETGIMDLTYNLAWELGRNLAVADKAFSSALRRLRNAIHALAMAEASKGVLEHHGMFFNRNAILTTLDNLGTRLNPLPSNINTAPHPRWACGTSKCGLAPVRSLTTLSNDQMAEAFQNGIQHAAEEVTFDLHDKVFTGKAPAVNTDWPVVLDWILDKMFLRDIPPHYMFPDASHLPRESLRTFHVDDNWMDCLIDGALSVANRFDKHDVEIIRALKMQVNAHLKEKVGGEYISVPSWGFLMRSSVVGAFPNLEVKAEPAKGKTASRSKLCVLNVIREDVLLAMFDRGAAGSEGEAERFSIAQPKHQQCYAVGVDVEETHVQMAIELPGGDGTTVMGRWEKDGTILVRKKDASEVADVEQVFDFDTRTLIFPALVRTLAKVFEGCFSTPTTSDQITSAVLADVLSLPVLKMSVEDEEPSAAAGELPYREIYTPPRTDPPSATVADPVVIMPARRQLPAKEPEQITSASPTSAATVTTLPQAQARHHSTPSAASALSQSLSADLPTPDWNPDHFAPYYPLPNPFLSLSTENIYIRDSQYIFSYYGPLTRMLFIPPTTATPTRPVLLINTTSYANVAGNIALHKLVLRIPVGPGPGTLFDPAQLKAAGQALAPRATVVGPRWLCHSRYENDRYVITVVPRVSNGEDFGWEVKELKGIQILLPEMDMQWPGGVNGVDDRERVHVRVGMRAQDCFLERVVVETRQEYTYDTTVNWAWAGYREESFTLGKLYGTE